MKYRVASGCVTVTGRPAAMSDSSRGSSEPRLPKTLPKRTET